jgi:hypothetical protein
MAEEPDNLTIRLLQDMRSDLQTLRAELKTRIDGLNERFDEVDLKIDGNTVLLNLVAGVTHDHEQRLQALESKSQS